MSQPNLFDGDPTVRFHGGNPESVAAHASIRGHKDIVRRQVVDYVRSRGQVGATSDEVEVALGMSHQTVSARLTEAKTLGEVSKTGLKRKTRSGRGAAVLIAVR